MENQKLEDAIAAFRAGDKAKARELLEQVVSETPDDARGWYYLAAVQTELARRKEYLERVLALEPGNDKAREMLDRTNERLNEAHEPVEFPKEEAVKGRVQGVPSASVADREFALPVAIPGAPPRVTVRELVSDGVALLRNSIGIFLKRPGAYEDEIKRATWWRFWLTVGTGSVVGAVFFALGQLFLEFRFASLLPGYGVNIFRVFLVLIFTIPMNMAAVYTGAYASHWYATKQANGIASLVQHSHTMAAVWLPANVINAALGALLSLLFGATFSVSLLFSGLGLAAFGLGLLITMVVSIAIGLYTLSILVKGIEILYKFTGGPLWITTLVMLVVTGLVYGILENILF